jgi:hypothetical protein
VTTLIVAVLLMFGSVGAAIRWATVKNRRLNPNLRRSSRFSLTYKEESHASDH